MTGNSSKPLVLIVDDTATNIKILVDVLKGEYEIGVATNGLDALEYVKKRSPALILLDILMPEMDGYEVCEILKKDETHKDIPIIFITALHEVDDKAKGFKLGAVDYITKPFKVVEVAARVQMHVELQQAREALKRKNQQLDQVSAKLSKYLPHQICQSIISGERDVKLETQRKQLTVFFSDIVGFTELTDSLSSETLSYLLNDYLNEMAGISKRHGGTLNKFIGDAILIFFGDPQTKGSKGDALACLQMSLEMKARMELLRLKWRGEGIEDPPRVRMGVTTGYCTVGNFGSEDRLEYTIIGGQVNLASRLESEAEANEILISHHTYSLVQDEVVCEEMGKIKVKGMAYPVKTYQLLGLKEDDEQGKSDYYKGIEKILKLLNPRKLSDEERQLLVEELQSMIVKFS